MLRGCSRSHSLALSEFRSRISIGTSSMCSSAHCTVPADFEPRNQHPEPAILFHLLLQLFELVADKLRDFSATQTSHVNMISPRSTFVIMSFAVDVHQVEFVNQSVPFEQPQRSVYRAAVNSRVEPLRLTQNLAGIQMFVRRGAWTRPASPCEPLRWSTAKKVFLEMPAGLRAHEGSGLSCHLLPLRRDTRHSGERRVSRPLEWPRDRS